ncbi:MAG: hypothetical protein ABL929_11380, partial [Ferruginibacter sp.]
PLEEISYTDKSFLYKEIIFDKKIQEQILLKLDGELAGEELKELNTLLIINEDAKSEYNLLQKTILQPENSIGFKDKALLYKKENIIYLGWLKWAAAAIFIGIGYLYISKMVYNTNTKNLKIVKNTNLPTHKIKNESTTITDLSKFDSTKQQVIVNYKTAISNTETFIATKQANKEKHFQTTKETAKETIKEDAIFVKNNTATTNSEKGNSTELTISNSTEIAVQNKIESTPQQIENLINTQALVAKVFNSSEEHIKNTVAKTTAASNYDKSDNKFLYIKEDVIRKSKAGSFLKKAKQFIERTANLKEGNNLQIAGFEIAAK